MTSNLEHPAPLSEVELRGFEWMPLLGDRLFESETWLMASDRGRVVALRLWWASWKQNPAGSLPAADRALCQLAGCGDMLDAWLSVKEEVMRGWVLCNDGRLYHPLVCEQAEISNDYRQHKTAKAEGQAGRKHREREDRRALFAALRGAGHILPFNTPTKVLREHADQNVTAPVTALIDTLNAAPSASPAWPTIAPNDALVTASVTACDGPVTADENLVTASVTINTRQDNTNKKNPTDSSLRKAGRSDEGSRLSEDWQPSPADREYAKNLSLNIDRVAEAFRCYWLTKPGKDGRRTRWELVWQRWCRTEADKPSARAPAPANSNGPLFEAPRRYDPPEKWFHLAEKTELDPSDGIMKPVIGGYYINVIADQVCEAALLDNAPGGDWGALIGWLRDGLDPETKILPAIRRVANGPRYVAPATLRYFDRAVREMRAA